MIRMIKEQEAELSIAEVYHTHGISSARLRTYLCDGHGVRQRRAMKTVATERSRFG